jgi:hypothetical protein
VGGGSAGDDDDHRRGGCTTTTIEESGSFERIGVGSRSVHHHVITVA